jgi:hypothetical protein
MVSIWARVSGADLCSPFSNFHFGGAETGSAVDRDRFAQCLSATPPGVYSLDRLFCPGVT